MAVKVNIECPGPEEARVFIYLRGRDDGKMHEMDECIVLEPGRGIGLVLDTNTHIRVEPGLPRMEAPTVEQPENKKVP